MAEDEEDDDEEAVVGAVAASDPEPAAGGPLGRGEDVGLPSARVEDVSLPSMRVEEVSLPSVRVEDEWPREEACVSTRVERMTPLAASTASASEKKAHSQPASLAALSAQYFVVMSE